MFDLQAALSRLNQSKYDFDQLQEILRQIRREHLGEISPEVGVRELLLLAIQKKWIREDDEEQFHIEVAKAA